MATTQIRKGQVELLNIVNTDISTNAAIDTNKLAEGTKFLKSDGTNLMSSDFNLNSYKIINLAQPVNPNDAARLADIQLAQAGLSGKEAARVLSENNTTLSGLQTIDDIVLLANDRVLLINQTDKKQNGLWLAQSSTWTRPSDFTGSTTVKSGAHVFIAEGTKYNDSGWIVSTDGPITVGTTEIIFAQFNGASKIVAGLGLTKSGNILNLGSSSTLNIAEDTVDLNTIGTAGTYTKVTTDAYGRVISGIVKGTTGASLLADYGITDAALATHTHAFSAITSKPTTLAGYGITDAAASSHTHTKSQITDFPTSLPASDVYAWAKAATKPTYAFSEITSKPTTISGYGITDIPTSLPASDVYAWAKAATKPTYAFSEITSKPTTISGYGITDAITTGNIGSQSVNYATSAGSAGAVSWPNISSKPTTLSGYGITDAAISSHNHDSVYTPLSSFRNIGNITVQAVAGSNMSCTTAQFISWYQSTYAFKSYAHTIARCSWDYSGNNDLSDGPASCDFAGSVIETWSNGTDFTIKIIRPTTGAGAYEEFIYNDQASGTYSPGWRRVWNDRTLTNLNQLTNGPGYITGINSTMVTNALGFTPYNSTNPNGYITSSGSCTSATSTSYLNVISGNECVIGNGYTGGSDLYVNYRGGNFGAFRFANGQSTGTLVPLIASDFKVGGSYSVIHTGNIGSQSVSSANNVNGTLLGKTGGQGFFTNTSWTSTDWSKVPIGGGGMGISGTPGAATTNYFYFLKLGNRDAGGGWGGIMIDYSGGEMYYGSTTVSSSNATWIRLITANTIGSQSVSNATTAAGLAVSSGRNNVANQIVRTDGNGYIQCGYINSNSGNEGNNYSPVRVWGTNGSDDYMRTYLTSALSVGYATNAGNTDTLDGNHATRFLWSESANGYYGMMTPTGSNSDWIRTTIQGIIPYNSGGASSIGTSSWPFTTMYATSYYVSSARDLKENIKEIKEDVLPLINNIDIVSFNYKTDEEKNKKIGFIADDTDEIFATKQHDTMDLYNTCGMLIKAVQELSSKIDNLEEENNKLKDIIYGMGRS